LFGLSVVVSAVVKAVVVARLAGGLESPVQVAPDHRVRIFSGDTENDLDTVSTEDSDGARPHSPGEHDRRSLLSQPHRVDPATVFGRFLEIARGDSSICLVHRVDRECFGAAEVPTKPSLL
jgi:hypothetical protein